MTAVLYTIIESDPQGADAMALLHAAAIEARKLYPELHDAVAPWPSNPPTPPRGAYFVAYDATQPVAMGAHRPLDQTTTEVRRMYVMADARRAGLGRDILQRIEEHAKSQGFTRLVLETGNRQLPAMRLYESCGFQRIAPFGDYVDDPTSVCYEKFIIKN
jgi:putative acetyltransferase